VTQYQAFTTMVNRYYANPDRVMDRIDAPEIDTGAEAEASADD
jgi:hypothetical protein